jgi:Ser/Thr protein kinase RdoA (MazF antagonist)
VPAPSPLQLTAEFSPLSETTATTLLVQHYGIDATHISRLATERDDTFVVTTPQGRHIAKFAHPLDDWATLHDQVTVLHRLAERAPDLPVQRVMPSREGHVLTRIIDGAGTARLLRVLSYLDGEVLGSRARPLEAMVVLGRLHARLAVAIADIGDDTDPPLLGAATPWNLLALDEYAPHLDVIDDNDLRVVVERTIERVGERAMPALRMQPRPLAHNDVHGDNVLVHTAPFTITGVLDFGDMCRTPRVADLAVAASYARGRVGATDEPWAAARAYVAGYETEQPLTSDEHALLPELVLLRLAQRGILNSAIAAANHSAVGYASRNLSAITRDLRELGESIPRTIGDPR